MHLVIILVGILVAFFAIKQLFGKVGSADSTTAISNPLGGNAGNQIALAFLSNGKLFYKEAQGEVRQIHSPYVQEMIDKMERHNERNAWKQNTSFSVSANGGMRQFDKDGAHILATSMQFFDTDSILYFLKDQVMGGLFSMDLKTGVEKRILHKQNLSLSDLNLDAASGKILCTSGTKDGATNVAMLNTDGGQYQELTGGDTLDSSPAWIPGAENQILYQSAGIARAANGAVLAVGNVSIQMLEVKTGKVTPVMDEAEFDFMHPRVCMQGNLYFIRRPYERPQYEMGNVILDTLLFPFRLLRAIFHYLNFFSMMYTRKPLTSASGPMVKADLKEIILKGKRIDAEKALRSETNIHGVPSLVPSSWQLISRNRNGNETVLASNVAAYDIGSDGNIIYSNGRGVFLLGHGNQTALILKSDLIGDVVAAIAPA